MWLKNTCKLSITKSKKYFSLNLCSSKRVTNVKTFLVSLSDCIILNATYKDNIILCGDLNTIISEVDRTSDTFDHASSNLVLTGTDFSRQNLTSVDVRF